MGLGLPFFLRCQQSRVRVIHSRGGRKRASRDPAEHRRERRVELVGMNPLRHAEHVRDVFRSSACGAWSCEGGVMQSGEGPIPILSRRRRRSFQRQVAVGLRSHGGGLWPRRGAPAP